MGNLDGEPATVCIDIPAVLDRNVEVSGAIQPHPRGPHYANVEIGTAHWLNGEGGRKRYGRATGRRHDDVPRASCGAKELEACTQPRLIEDAAHIGRVDSLAGMFKPHGRTRRKVLTIHAQEHSSVGATSRR
jgi:hypothetical protein